MSTELSVKELARTLQRVIQKYADEPWCSWPGNDIQWALAEFLGDAEEMVRLMEIMEAHVRELGVDPDR